MKTFQEHYDNEEILNEDILTGAFFSIFGKMGTAINNLFKKSKSINISMDFLKVFEQINKSKYIEIVEQLSQAYINKKSYKNIFIKDLRQGDVTGNIFTAFSRSWVSHYASKFPNAAEPNSPLYKDKNHKVVISVYLLSNGGKISLWNMPKQDTDPSESYNADKRIYAVSMDDGGIKAFETIKGMSYRDWLTTIQTQETQKKQEERQTQWKEVVEIDKKKFDLIYDLKTFPLNQGIDKIEIVKPSENIVKGKNWHFIKPEGWMSIYQNKEGKYKLAFSDDLIRIKFNEIYDYDIPTGAKVSVTPENTQITTKLL